MHNTVTVQVLDCGDHLTHDVSGVMLSELLGRHDAVEELATAAPLHDDVDVAVIDVALIELDDVGVIHLLKDGKLFLEQADIFGDVRSQDRLDSVGNLRVSLEGGCAD